MQVDHSSDPGMPTTLENGLSVSRNLIEYFVMEEVERHFNALPQQTKDFVSKSDIVAYALNRLPAMYATTRRGYLRQTSEIRITFADKIAHVVQQGIAAVRTDPFRFSKPLEKRDDVGVERALEQLRSILGDRSITWDNVAEAVQSRLQQYESNHTVWAPTVNARAQFDWTPIALRELTGPEQGNQH